MNCKDHCSKPDDCLRPTCCYENCFAGANPDIRPATGSLIERRRLRQR